MEPCSAAAPHAGNPKTPLTFFTHFATNARASCTRANRQIKMENEDTSEEALAHPRHDQIPPSLAVASTRSPYCHMSSGVVTAYTATIGSSTGGKGQF
jgi:hypothetical protein